MEIKNKTTISFKTVKTVIKKPLFLVPVTIMGLLFICTLSLVIWKPEIVKGEYNIQSIVDMLLNHEERISNLETKTDETQTQTNQNTEDVKKLQDSTGTQAADPVDPVQTPVTKGPVPKDEDPINSGPPPEQAVTSWTTPHGTYQLKDVGTVLPMYLGEDFSVTIGYSFSGCSYFLPGKTLNIPAGTKIVRNPSRVTSTPYAFDLSNLYNVLCQPETPRTYHFEYHLDKTSTVWFDAYDIWW